MPILPRRPSLAGALLTALLASVPLASMAVPVAPAPPREPMTPAQPEAPGCRRAWVEPVDAPVVDPFRPPDHRFGPGNRGLEYGTEPGQPVVAVADGVVTFAGPVAGSPLVVIDHGSGLRSTSVHLLEATVGRGRPVTQGEAIGTADHAFHLGARVEGRYLDPAELIDGRCLVVRLVPV